MKKTTMHYMEVWYYKLLGMFFLSIVLQFSLSNLSYAYLMYDIYMATAYDLADNYNINIFEI